MKDKTIIDRLSWKYIGFSVYIDTKIDFTIYNEDAKPKMEQIVRYVSKPFYSMNRVIYKIKGSTVLYKGEYIQGVKQNFQTFSPTDFIAAVSAHVPKHRQKYITYYGWYSNKCRGMRNKDNKSNNQVKDNITEIEETTEAQKYFKKTWAELIQQVWADLSASWLRLHFSHPVSQK